MKKRTLLTLVFLGLMHTFTHTLLGQTGAALDFGGGNDYVDLGTNFDYDATSSFTVEFWMKPTQSGGWYGVFSKETWSEGKGYLIYQSSTSIRFTTPNNGAGIIAANTLTLGSWSHVACVFDNGNASIFIDGVLEVSGALNLIANPTQTATIGVRHHNSGIGVADPFNGELDEVRVWSTARCPEEITYYKDCELTGTETGLEAYYQFNQGIAEGTNTSVTTLDDLTSNNHDGTLTNFALTGTSSNWVAPGGVTTGNTCSGAPTAPEILVEGNSTEIPDGDTSPMAADDTDFGTQATGSMTDHTFTIKNTGTGALNLTGNPIVAISGASEFSIETQPSASSIASGGADLTFVVRYAPTAAATHTATISIANDDCDENPYTFDVTGTSIVPQPALHCDGIDDYVLSENTMNLYGSTPTTIEFWMNTNSAVGAIDAPIGILDGDNNNSSKYYFLIHPTFGPNSWFIDNTGGYSLTSSALPLNTWVHIAITYDGAGNLNGYINGVPADNPTHSRTYPAINGRLIIGGRGVGSNDAKWNGAVDEVRIWNDVRTQAEIHANMNCDIAQEANLVAYYRFNEGVVNTNNTSVTSVSDYSGNGNCGTFHNFALTGTTSNYIDGAIGTCNAITLEEVGTAPADNCTAYSAVVNPDGNWTAINDGSGNVILEVNAPAGTDLGLVTVEIMRRSAIETHNDGNGDQLKTMPRYYHVSSANYGAGANFSSNVGLRFYFEKSDLNALNAANMGENGTTSYTAGQIDFTHYSGPNEDCDLSNNTMLPANVELIDSPTMTAYGCGGFYLETSVGHFSEFIAHEPSSQPLLPVELTFFRAEVQEKEAYLTWQTASELNNAGFYIEHSTNAQTWETIGFVNGKGTSNSINNYEFVHETPAAGANYYRLEQMDADGQMTYSNIELVHFDSKQPTIQIFPNPVTHGQVNIHIAGLNSPEVRVHLIDLAGRTWFNQTANEAQLNLNISELPSGIYIAEILTNGKVYRQKLMVE